MDKIKIITDGSCDLSHEVLNKFNINVVPLGVSFGEEHYTAGVDMARTPTPRPEGGEVR